MGDVAVAALGVNDLRILVCGRADDFGHVADDHRRNHVLADRAVLAQHKQKAHARTGETSVRVQQGVGVLLILAVTEYMVGEPAGRNYFL